MSLTAGEYDALPEVLEASEVATILDSSTVQVRRWAAAGVIPAVRIAGRWRFSKSRLEDFIAGGGSA